TRNRATMPSSLRIPAGIAWKSVTGKVNNQPHRKKGSGLCVDVQAGQHWRITYGTGGHSRGRIVACYSVPVMNMRAWSAAFHARLPAHAPELPDRLSGERGHSA